MAELKLYTDIVAVGSGRSVVHFRAETDGVYPEGTVSLARRPDHCFYTLDNLEAHNGHAPAFPKGELTIDQYIERVRADVEKLVNEANKADTLIGSWEVADY